MTRVGTAHFVTLAHAVAYYRPYGFDRSDVQRKLAEGEIFIGPPVLKAGERLVLTDNGQRYAIESD